MDEDDLTDITPFEEDESESLDEEIIEDVVHQKVEEPPIDHISPSDIPIRIQIEMGRFQVSLEELQKMEPGYKLPIEINPRIVDLTVNGKSIGKGEIIEFGDVIGVKILQLYS